ncbi:MAG: aldehyde:ferredoxin oxidoreductase [Polyangiaceae bacterium]|nr:aldehyde:ferredoxin oxidoreductase [Polyangiaceae bacterium]
MYASGGYFGVYALIDLNEIERGGGPILKALSVDELRPVIGGVGLAALLLCRYPDALVAAFGPLVGTPLTTSAKWSIAAKSPATHRFCDALSSSDFALLAKRLGVDALVIRGGARAGSVLLIEGGVRARLASMSGELVYTTGLGEVTARLQAAHPGFAFAAVGPAAHHGVRFACITNDGRHAGRGGLGTRMAQMGLVAIGVLGKQAVPIANVSAAAAIAKDLAQRSLGPATAKYRELGTVANVAAFNRLAVLPTRNFQASTFEGAEGLSGEALRATRDRGRGSCRNCTIGCEHFFEVAPGEAPQKVEYENVYALGPLCGVSNPSAVLAAARLCDELGLDTISTGASIAFAMECEERGLFKGTPWENEARGLRFGDAERMTALIEAIAFRRGRLGDLLANGTREAARALGPEAERIAPHVKGLELPGYEPRALQTMALGLSVAARGADHNRSGAYEADFSGKVNRFEPSAENANFAIASEDRAAAMDSLILCKFLRGALTDFWGESALMLEAVTGLDFSATELQQAARRVVGLKKLFNEEAGWTEAEDTLPARFFDEALPTGAARGAVLSRENFNVMKRAYYAQRGWEADGRLSAGERSELLGLIARTP